ncbi:MAG: hypothetical protein HY544_01605 [Candidatus Diapherotrites archaeon]|uniref:Uncharacterized protein n=1 Tax=Candidatus Iainarchaeum sp. TaxID=3101447 RepID=A0A8T3YJF9_9ARCH|nr:hypothetical protein [Candidatus Diapherotrites archaeon]
MRPKNASRLFRIFPACIIIAVLSISPFVSAAPVDLVSAEISADRKEYKAEPGTDIVLAVKVNQLSSGASATLTVECKKELGSCNLPTVTPSLLPKNKSIDFPATGGAEPIRVPTGSLAPGVYTFSAQAFSGSTETEFGNNSASVSMTVYKNRTPVPDVPPLGAILVALSALLLLSSARRTG